MATIRHSIQVKVPVYTVYNQLTQFEEYPRFMEDVESVWQIDDTHLHWTTKMANRPVEWDAEITEQEADHCIAWHNTSGPTNAGKVEVQPLGQDVSEVTMTLFSEPEQVPGSMAGYTEEDMARRLEQDLVRLKDLVETGKPGTSGWRSEVNDGSGAMQAGEGAASGQEPAQHQRQSFTIPMRHLGQLPQDTSAEEHGGVPTSDSAGRAMHPGGQGTLGAVKFVAHDERHTLVGIVSLGDVATHASGSEQKQDLDQAVEMISMPSEHARMQSANKAAPSDRNSASVGTSSGDAMEAQSASGPLGTDSPAVGTRSVEGGGEGS